MAAHTPTRSCHVLLGLAVLWGMIGLIGAESWADDNELDRATLRGIEGAYVLAEDFKPEVERYGLTKQQLEIDVALQLRKAGIRVFTREEALRAPGNPYLHVHASVFLHSDGLAIYTIIVGFNQRASLDINAVSALVTTWNTARFGSVGALRLRDTLRNDVRDLVDQFITAYLSVNPRSSGIAAPSSTSPRRDLVRQVQERLQTVGYNPGTIDGAMGPQTRDALRWFQNTKGLRSTGDLDDATLNALGVR